MYGSRLPAFRVSLARLTHRRHQLRVELEVDLRRRDRPPQPRDGSDKVEKLRLDREERRLRQLALAQHIDHLVVSGQVDSLAEIAKLCGVSRARVSRARVSQVIDLFEQQFLAKSVTRSSCGDRTCSEPCA